MIKCFDSETMKNPTIAQCNYPWPVPTNLCDFKLGS